MAFASLTGKIQALFQWAATTAGVSSSLGFAAPANNNQVQPSIAIALGGNVAGGANEVACNILAISASSSATLNLQSLTDVLGVTGVVLVRIKNWIFWLLNATQDTINGTAASAVVVQGGASNPNTLTLGGTGPTYTITNGNFWVNGDGSAGGVTVSAGACNVKFANSDSGNSASLLYALAGATT